MADLEPTDDPYRVLGVLRAASTAQIKAAHRRLAKRYHPDGEHGDEDRFMAVQEAYQLLSDPVRRRQWDLAHAPGPVRRTSSRGRTGAARPEPEVSRPVRGARVRRRPASRTRTWSAEHVPWWEDFRPGAKSGAQREAQASAQARAAAPEPDDETVNEFDVFSRSSGAAWSSAARRHFRRGTDDLPSRGVWRYRGTQVVTGAEARRVAAEEEEEKPPR
jgi:curved DNA-binding protein CbpA